MPHRTDANQAEIMAALRAVGASVCDLHEVGSNVPDLLVGYRGCNWLLEVKSEKGSLSKGQQEFFLTWQGLVALVRCVDDALWAIGATNG